MTVRLSTLPAFGIIVVSIAYVIEITTFPLILGALTDTLHLTRSQGLWLASAYKIALVCSLLIGGPMGDRFGKERIFAVGTAFFSLSSLALLFVQNGETALVLRVLQGIGAGLFSPMIPALIAARRRENAVSALSRWGMITGLAAAVYPFIAAVLTQSTSWQGGWLVVPLFATVALLGLPMISDRQDQTPNPVNEASAKVALSASVWAIIAYVFLNYGATTWFIYAIATMQSDAISLTQTGVLLFVLWSVFALGNLAVSQLNRLLSMPTLLQIGAIFNAIGILLLCYDPTNLYLAFFTSGLIGIGMALNNVPTTDLAFRMSPQSAHGRVASLDIIAARLGGAACVVLIPFHASASLWFAPVFAVCVVAFSFALVLFSMRGTPKLAVPAE
ncbi:MFS transporter [Nereida sp. MMG025]|uniref:MFS transporter n=1 Tax=Nereida sp. MMG025 TaxID=2909981 RepID=UPI001F022D19|nr:MFS transporter [Nereida sp. MMG025]MCF6444146.1 MFS transporter [Nereida sp. MMG025]